VRPSPTGMFQMAQADPAADIDRSEDVLLLHDQAEPDGPPAPAAPIGPPADLAPPVQVAPASSQSAAFVKKSAAPAPASSSGATP
jgi:rod shape-determining protein MreC